MRTDCRPQSRPMPAPSTWAELDDSIAALLESHGVTVDDTDSRSMVFYAVPVGPAWSKARTNLLLHRPSYGLVAGTDVYVDADLHYKGEDELLRDAAAAPCYKNWRRCPLPRRGGSLGEVLTAALGLLDSPIVAQVAPLVVAAHDEPTSDSVELPPLLGAVGEIITPTAAAAAYEASFRKDLADQLAALLSGGPLCRGVVLWAEQPGSGKDHLMLAAAHPLLVNGQTTNVLRVSAAKAASGSYFEADVDASLMRLTSEAESVADCTLLIQDLDLLITGSAVSYSILCHALDRGLRVLATIRSKAFFHRAARDGYLMRRLFAVHVEELNRDETAQVLRGIADASHMSVPPEAIDAAIKMTHGTETSRPGAGLSLLAAAVQMAACRRGAHMVTPDDIFFVDRLNEWPTDATRDEE